MAKKWTDARHRQQAQRKADKINAKVAAEIPLFADQAEKVSPEAIYWHWRRHCSAGGEHGVRQFEGNRLLQVFQVRFIRDFARGHMTAEQFTLMDARCFATYPGAEYWYDFWRQVLTGEKIPLRYGKVENRQPGQPATIVVESWPPADWKPPFANRDEFYAKFPYKDQDPPRDHPGAVQPNWKGTPCSSP